MFSLERFLTFATNVHTNDIFVCKKDCAKGNAQKNAFEWSFLTKGLTQPCRNLFAACKSFSPSGSKQEYYDPGNTFCKTENSNERLASSQMQPKWTRGPRYVRDRVWIRNAVIKTKLVHSWIIQDHETGLNLSWKLFTTTMKWPPVWALGGVWTETL